MQPARDLVAMCVLDMVLSCLSCVLQLSWIEQIEAQIEREKEVAYLVSQGTHMLVPKGRKKAGKASHRCVKGPPGWCRCLGHEDAR